MYYGYNRFWETWNRNLNSQLQKERWLRSFDDECTPHYVSPDSMTGTFSCNEGTFICSLESNFCNCDEHMYTIHAEGDDVPCRYMYRLARELNIVDLDGKLKVPFNLPISEDKKKKLFRGVIDKLEHYSEDIQDNFRKQLHVLVRNRDFDGKPFAVAVKRDEYDFFIKEGFFTEINDSITLFQNQRAVVKRMDDISYEYPANLSRTKAGTIRVAAKYYWCLQHPDIVANLIYRDRVVISYSNSLGPVVDWVKSYLTRKFCDTVHEYEDPETGKTGEQRPSGARYFNCQTLAYEFPDDYVTELLDFYGHNRCVIYSPPREVYHSNMRPLICKVFISKDFLA